MDFKINEGIVFEETKIVGNTDTAMHYGSGNLEVFATPAMVALMELTALKSVSVLKDQYGFDTVGIEINVKHIKATSLNDTVKCISKLVKVDGRALDFEIEAFDSEGKIGVAIHKRFVIDPVKFMAKL
jgi:predicted thioesterase